MKVHCMSDNPLGPYYIPVKGCMERFRGIYESGDSVDPFARDLQSSLSSRWARWE